MTDRFEAFEARVSIGTGTNGLVEAARDGGMSRHTVLHGRATDRTFSQNGDQFEFGSPFGDTNHNSRHEGHHHRDNNNDETYSSDSDLRNSPTYVEGQRVRHDRHGNTIIDRSHLTELPENHPVREVIGSDGVTYVYKDGRRVMVSRDGHTSVEGTDGNWTLIPGDRPFNPLV